MIEHLWLITPEVMPKIEGALLSDKVAEISLEDQGLRREAARARTENAPAGLVVSSSGVAQISVTGPLLPVRSWILDLFGIEHTSYEELQGALAKAEADSNVRELEATINSPGGMVAGLFELLADLEKFSKPKRAKADLAASAAYAIAAQCGQIEGASKMATFGSIGVAVSYYVTDRIVDVTNSASPDKRPDIKTEAGRAVVRAYLDEIYELFADAIATGRGTTPTTIAEQYGGGRVFLADQAKARGMIDSVSGGSSGGTNNNQAAMPAERTKSMDLETLKAQHPEAYKAAVSEGEKKERSRVAAHLKMGSASVSREARTEFEACHKFIQEGASVQDDEVFAEYQTASLNRRDVSAREHDSQEASDAIAGSKGGDAAPDMGDLVAEKLHGKAGG